MFTKIKAFFMNWEINYAVIKDVLVKLGLFFITGGIIGYYFDNKIDATTAFIVIINGIAFIFIGALRHLKKEE